MKNYNLDLTALIGLANDSRVNADVSSNDFNTILTDVMAKINTNKMDKDDGNGTITQVVPSVAHKRAILGDHISSFDASTPWAQITISPESTPLTGSYTIREKDNNILFPAGSVLVDVTNTKNITRTQALALATHSSKKFGSNAPRIAKFSSARALTNIKNEYYRILATGMMDDGAPLVVDFGLGYTTGKAGRRLFPENNSYADLMLTGDELGEKEEGSLRLRNKGGVVINVKGKSFKQFEDAFRLQDATQIQQIVDQLEAREVGSSQKYLYNFVVQSNHNAKDANGKWINRNEDGTLKEIPTINIFQKATVSFDFQGLGEPVADDALVLFERSFEGTLKAVEEVSKEAGVARGRVANEDDLVAGAGVATAMEIARWEAFAKKFGDARADFLVFGIKVEA